VPPHTNTVTHINANVVAVAPSSAEVPFLLGQATRDPCAPDTYSRLRHRAGSFCRIVPALLSRPARFTRRRGHCCATAPPRTDKWHEHQASVVCQAGTGEAVHASIAEKYGQARPLQLKPRSLVIRLVSYGLLVPCSCSFHTSHGLGSIGLFRKFAFAMIIEQLRMKYVIRSAGVGGCMCSKLLHM
jgi:hypothetical protein